MCENQQKSSGYHAYISKTAQPNNNRYKPVSKHSFRQPANLRLAILASSTRFINYSCRTRACAVQCPQPLARAVVSSSSRVRGHGLVQSEKYWLNRSKESPPPPSSPRKSFNFMSGLRTWSCRSLQSQCYTENRGGGRGWDSLLFWFVCLVYSVVFFCFLSYYLLFSTRDCCCHNRRGKYWQ